MMLVVEEEDVHALVVESIKFSCATSVSSLIAMTLPFCLTVTWRDAT